MESGTPVEEGHVPVRKDDGVDVEPLMVTVDGLEATCIIVDTPWRSPGVSIEFKSPHPKLGGALMREGGLYYFGTKYFRFISPGVMEWGDDGETLEILHR